MDEKIKLDSSSERKENLVLVISSHKKLEIGKIYNSMTDPNSVLLPNQAFKVVKESNIDEWVKCLKFFGKEIYEEHLNMPHQYYYEIQTD